MTGTTANPGCWGCPRSAEMNLSVVQRVLVCVCVCLVCVRGAGWSEEPKDATDGARRSPRVCSRCISTL